MSGESEERDGKGDDRGEADSNGRDRFAASAGFVVAGLAVASSVPGWTPGLAGVGVGNPVGVVAGVVALAAFGARRYGRDEAWLSPLAGVGSGVVVLTSLWGVLAPAVGPGTEPAWVGPALPLGGVLGFLGVGLAILDRAGAPRAAVVRRGTHAAAMLGVGLVGLFFGSLAAAVAQSMATALGANEAWAYGVASAVSPLGFAVVAVGAVLAMGEDVRYFDVRIPSRREWAWAGGALLAMLVVLLTVSTIEGWLGLSQATHDTIELAKSDPAILLVLVPVSLLFIGPGEELLNRNVVQKHLYTAFSRRGAILVASVFFASLHVFAYWTAGPAAVAVALLNLLAIALVLAVAYERTGNVVVVALAHGGYDAVQFLYAYLTIAH